MPDIAEELTKVDDFIRNPIDREWLQIGPLRVYCRKARKWIYGKHVETFDIANVDVPPCQRGQGLFKKFIIHVEKRVIDKVIYIEKITSRASFLIPFFERRGYKIVRKDEDFETTSMAKFME